MSWTLVAETNTGWKKYRDSYGNDRYIGPDGFTNNSGYNGSLGNAEKEIEHVPDSANSQDNSKVERKWKDRRGGSGTIGTHFEKEDVTDKYKYEKSLNYKIQLGGVPVENVAWSHYTQVLLEKTKSLSNTHETFFWRIYYEIITADDGVDIDGQSIMNTSQVETEDINLLQFNFRENKRKLMDIKDSYTDVLIDTFEICVRDYGEALQ